MIAQNAAPIAFGENLIYSLETTASDTAFSSPVVGPGDVLFFKLASDALQVKVELFAPGANTPDATISGAFNNDIELIYPIPEGHPTGAYILLISNIGIWTGDDCITLQRMNEPPTAVHMGCEATKESTLPCDSDIKAFKYLVEANALSRIVVEGVFAPEAWVCASDGSILQYGAESFNNQLVLDSIPAPETGCYYVFVSDDAAFWAGDFSISYTTLLGECASVVINNNISIDELCEGDTLMLTAASTLDDIAYSWTGPNDFISNEDTIYIYDISPDQAGQYEVTASSPGICDSKAARNVVVHALPEVTALSDPEEGALCDGEALGLSVNTNASSPKTCYWEGPNFTSTACIASIFQTDLEDSGIYTIWVTDSKGCTNRDEVEITVHPLPMAVISSPADGQACMGETLVLNVTTDSIDASFSWTGPNGFMSNLKTPSIENVSSANQGYYYATVIDNITGCEKETWDFINIRSVPNVNIFGNTEICLGESTNLTASGSSGDDYDWSTGDDASMITVSPESTTTYTVTVTNNFGCEGVESTDVLVNDLPSIGVPPENAIIEQCEGEGTTVICLASNAQNPDYSWTFNGIVMEGQCVFVEDDASASGIYIGEVTDGQTTCTNEIVVPVTIAALPNVDILATPDIQLCDGSDFTLCAESDATNPSYEWAGPNNFMSSIICASQNDVTNDYSGGYHVTVTSNTSNLQCSNTASITLEIGLPLQSDLEAIPGGIQVSCTGGFPPYIYTLMPGGQMNTTGIFEDIGDGSYYIEIVDENGCEHTTDEIAVVGAPSIIAESGISVFPNPSNGFIHIYCSSGLKESVQANILDAAGQNIKSFRIKDKQQTIDLSELPAGVYWLRIADAHRAEAIKLVLTY